MVLRGYLISNLKRLMIIRGQNKRDIKQAFSDSTFGSPQPTGEIATH
jgi:hypothetical protein